MNVRYNKVIAAKYMYYFLKIQVQSVTQEMYVKVLQGCWNRIISLWAIHVVNEIVRLLYPHFEERGYIALYMYVDWILCPA